MEEKKNTTFEYTYSAPTEAEKKQIENIRRRYEEKPKAATTAVEQIRALDAKVRNTATVWGLVFGVVGCLTFGFGLTLILEWSKWILGIVFMAVGCPPMVFAYPIHQWKLKKGKEKYGAEILRLSEQALQNKE